ALLIAHYEVHQGRLRDSIAMVLKALARLGITIDQEPKTSHLLVDFLRTKRAIRGRSPRELSCLPEATDPRTWIAVRLLDCGANAAFVVNRKLAVRLVLTKTRLVVEAGHSPVAAGAYSSYGTILARFGDFTGADAFCQLALELLARYPNKRLEAYVKITYAFL